MDQVDHDKGIYKLLPQDELIAFLSHPLTASLYFRDWCLPFFCENTMDERLSMIANLGLVHADLVTDTEFVLLSSSIGYRTCGTCYVQNNMFAVTRVVYHQLVADVADVRIHCLCFGWSTLHPCKVCPQSSQLV